VGEGSWTAPWTLPCDVLPRIQVHSIWVQNFICCGLPSHYLDIHTKGKKQCIVAKLLREWCFSYFIFFALFKLCLFGNPTLSCTQYQGTMYEMLTTCRWQSWVVRDLELNEDQGRVGKAINNKYNVDNNFFDMVMFLLLGCCGSHPSILICTPLALHSEGLHLLICNVIFLSCTQYQETTVYRNVSEVPSYKQWAKLMWSLYSYGNKSK
jgi:hypothetical protein